MEFDKIAAAIQRARLKSGLTQKQVATALAKSQTTVAAWETGRAQPSAATIVQLSELFNVSTDYLLGVSLVNHHETTHISNELKLQDLPAQDKIKIDSYIQKVVSLCAEEAHRTLSPTFQLTLDCLFAQLKCISNIIEHYRNVSVGLDVFKDPSMQDGFYNRLSDEDKETINKLISLASKAPKESVFAHHSLYEVACSDGALGLMVLKLQTELSKSEDQASEE